MEILYNLKKIYNSRRLTAIAVAIISFKPKPSLSIRVSSFVHVYKSFS